MRMQEKTLEQLTGHLEKHFGSLGCILARFRGELTLEVPCEHLLVVAKKLKEMNVFRFEQLMDVCGCILAGAVLLWSCHHPSKL